MAKQVFTTLAFNGGSTVTGLPTPTAASDAAPKSYVDNAIEGLAWKDDTRVATQADTNLASPGAAIDGVTMTVGDRVLVKAQAAGAENGLYIWNGAASPMGRAPDATTGGQLNNAVVSVGAGTDAGTTWRCTSVDAAVGTDAITWQPFLAGAAPASETTAGIAELATQAEVDAGVDDTRIVTPAKLAAWTGRLKKYSVSFGDGSATQYDITHNIGSRDVTVVIYRVSAPYDEVVADVGHLDTNTVRLTFASAPTANQFRIVVVG